MLYRFSIVFLIGLCLVACSSGSMQEESVPVIRFKPDEARTLKISELFDGYEVLTFKGIVCNRIGDFVKMGDRIVATSIVTEGMTDVVTLSVFDSAGEFQHTLGRFGRGPDEYLYLPHEIVKVAISKFANISNLFEPWASVAGGIINKTFDGIVQYVSGIFDSIQPKYNPSAGVEQWRNIATKALKMTGQFSKSNLDLLLYQMQTESGGNPKAINKWDINAIKGTPSKGLMQVIDPTFRTYAYPGYDKDIYDPLSNILASIRYTLARYGSLSNGWKGHGYASGIGRITLADLIPKYSVGGFPEDGLFMANHNELVGQFSDGRTAVANNLDIQKGIEEAAYRGFSRANAENREQENLLRELIQAVRDGKRIVVDGRELVSITDSRRARNGYSFT